MPVSTTFQMEFGNVRSIRFDFTFWEDNGNK